LYRELAGQRVKVSLRSKGDVDVHALATEFGGGGHRNASGIVLAGPLVRVVEQITARATALLAAAPAPPGKQPSPLSCGLASPVSNCSWS